MKNIVCKSLDEIVRAHDIIDSCLRGEIPELVIEEITQREMRYQRDVLCWLLGHERGVCFQENLKSLVKCARSVGYELYGSLCDSQAKKTN